MPPEPRQLGVGAPATSCSLSFSPRSSSTPPVSEWYNEKNQWGRESHSPRVPASNPGTRLRLHSRPQALSPASRSSCALGAPHAALVPAAARWVGVRYCAGVPGSAPRSRAPPASAEPTSTPERAVPLSPSSARPTEVAAEAGAPSCCIQRVHYEVTSNSFVLGTCCWLQR